MKQKLYYIKNETAEKAIYKNLEKQRFSVIEKDSGPPMVLSFSDDKNVTDEYEYVYIPREMSKKEVEGRFEVEKQCPMCGTITSIYLTDEDMDKYSWYSNSRFNRRGSGLPAPYIQNLFPDRTEEERELMMSGYCYWCQEVIFGEDEFLLMTEAEFSMEPDHLIAYNRADHDGYRWWNKWFPQKGTDGNQYMVQEMEKFSAYILEEQLGKGISDIPKLGAYYGAEPSEDQEYHLYCEGTYCNFHVKLINRKRSYNVYIYVYETEE